MEIGLHGLRGLLVAHNVVVVIKLALEPAAAPLHLMAARTVLEIALKHCHASFNNVHLVSVVRIIKYLYSSVTYVKRYVICVKKIW
jgi:hypothetical protein